MASRNGLYVETSFSRKVLPTLPNDLDRSNRQNQYNSLVYGRYLKEFLLSSEYKKVKDDPPSGMYVIPSGVTPYLWHGVLFVRKGFYQGGVFRFSVKISEAFPDTDQCPQVVFGPPIYHPFIDPESGQFDLSGAFDKWCCSVNHLQQVLKYVRNAFYSVPVDDNPFAFWQRARREVEASLQRVGSQSQAELDDPHALVFSDYVPQVHDLMRVAFKKPLMEYGSKSLPGSSGISYIRRPDSSSPETRDELQVASDSDYVTM